VAFPLAVRDQLVGVISLAHGGPLFDFSRAWMGFAEASMNQVALSIANARLFASLRQSYEELEKTRAEKVKQERLAALGELSAVVAHEVRNPLGVIFNAVGSLRRLLQPEGDAKILIDMLAEESDRLNRMVSELLDFARPNPPSFEPDDLGSLLQDALTVASAQAGPGCEWELSVDGSLDSVRMDRRMLRQALVNVLVNAFQAMPRGGTVRARAMPEVKGGKRWARIDLSDEGPGIAPELLPRIFEPFFTTKAQGTGLGLAVVRRIVEDHLGEVEVTSSVGGGTTFTFRLPFEPERGRSVA
jgi:signal transduction histidine kinase